MIEFLKTRKDSIVGLILSIICFASARAIHLYTDSTNFPFALILAVAAIFFLCQAVVYFILGNPRNNIN